MKIYLTFKTPNVLEDAAKEFADEQREELYARRLDKKEVADDEELDQVRDEAFEKVMKLGAKFVTSGEYVSIEMDLDTQTYKLVGR